MPFWWQNRQNRQIPGILRVYLEKPVYTRVIPALLHAFAFGTTHTAATLIKNPAYHFRIPIYHTTPKLIKISPNTSLIPVNIEHCGAPAAAAGGYLALFGAIWLSRSISFYLVLFRVDLTKKPARLALGLLLHPTRSAEGTLRNQALRDDQSGKSRTLP